MNFERKAIRDMEEDFMLQKFNVEMTGLELVRLWYLSYHNEAGENHASGTLEDGDEPVRFARPIRRFLDVDDDELKVIFKKLDHGKYNGTF